MSGIKKLAGQTMWYGASSIVARFLNYFLTPLLLLKLSSAEYGEMTLVYAAIPFLNILFTYGLETSYFRFAREGEKVYDTLSVSIFCTTLLLTAGLWLFREPIARVISIGEHPEYISWTAAILFFDTLSALPFARLRQEGKPRKYALVKIAGIVVNIALVYYFYFYCAEVYRSNANDISRLFYRPDAGALYVFVANFFQSLITLLLLSKELFSFRLRFDTALWKRVMRYSLPLLVVGVGGMINETFSRLMLGWWLPGSDEEVEAQVGTFGAVYKLAILISLFIQAFRLGAEPFFFKQAEGSQPQRTYARVMKFFVITLAFTFLFVTLYLDIWKYFITNHSMWPGLKVVPILLFANIFLGIYYNLTIWYKLSDKTMAGVYITLLGAAITLLVNWLLIPHAGYVGSAWGTFLCYGTMMVTCYLWGQKEYPVPYAWKKLVAYLVIVALLYGLHSLIARFTDNLGVRLGSGTLILAAFAWFIFKVEKHEFRKMPYIGRFVR